MDLPALVAHHLGRNDGLVALESDARTWSYAELDEATRERAAQLRRLCPDGGRVVLVGEHTADALIWALAVMRSGLGYTPLNPALPAERMRQAVRVAAPGLVVCCTEASLAVLRGDGAAGRVL
ncbi:AMP-binding protein, partial [Streptomyces sp. LS1784]